MPRHRESLDSVKERLIREQKVEQTEKYETCCTQDRGSKILRFPTTVKKRTDLGYGGEEETRIRQPRLKVRLLFHFFVVCLSVCFLFFVHCFSCSRLVEMTEQGWRGKGEKVLRRSPRKRGKTCGRPFTAPRKVAQSTSNVKKRTVQTHKDDSEVQLLTESEVKTSVNLTKAVEDNADSEVQEVTETKNERDIAARHETMAHDKQVTTESDTTESTPDIFRLEEDETRGTLTEASAA